MVWICFLYSQKNSFDFIRREGFKKLDNIVSLDLDKVEKWDNHSYA